MASTKNVKSPTQSEQQERVVPVVQKQHGGMIKGDTPLSVIGLSRVYRYINAIGHGAWAEGRPGTRRYSKARLPEITFTADIGTNRLTTINRFETGDPVRVRSDGTLPLPLDENTVYYAIVVSTAIIQVAQTAALAVAGTAIDITTAGTGTHYIRYAGTIRASLDHKKEARIIKVYGRRVYVAEKNLESYTEVVNLESVDPQDVDSSLIESGSNALLASGHIYRIVLDGLFYYMYRLSCPVPDVMLGEVAATPAAQYGYHYVFALARITGTGIRNRLTTGAELVFESGTCKVSGSEKYYSEWFFSQAIGPVADVAAGAAVISKLTLPIACQSITHFPLYRSKNIGSTTGGAGNNGSYFVWDDDVPVCKAISVTVALDVATPVAGQEGFCIGDVGSILRSNAAGTRSAVITKYNVGGTVDLALNSLNATEDVGIGRGRVMTASQAGLLITRTAGDTFVAADEGRPFYWGDGGEVVIRRYIDANSAEACTSETHASQAATIQCATGTYAFERYWNDTVRDDGTAVNEVGLAERMLSGRDLYIPQVNFDPVPSSDILVSDSGFTVFAKRDDNDYWYSNIGAKPYIEGQYRADHQFGKLKVAITDMRIMPAMVIFFCKSKTLSLALNVPIPNVGNPDFGEYIQKLTEPGEIDGEIGVIHYKTIAFVNASLLIALTNEPAVRKFDGHNWSQENFAISGNGLPAVVQDLNKIDGQYGLIGWYSQRGGYKIYARKWVEV
jgi:hypothetical protein